MRNWELKTNKILTGLLPWLFLNIVLNFKLLVNTNKMLFSQEYCKAKNFSYEGILRLLKDIKKLKNEMNTEKKNQTKNKNALKMTDGF